MKAGFSINERQRGWFGIKNFNYIVVFNWEVLNEIDLIGTNDLETTHIEYNTVAVFKIKWK